MSTAEMVSARQEQQPIALRHELSIDELVAQVRKVQLVMKEVMKEGEHYGKIPGTPKPTLYKAGAEKLLLVFRLDPQYQSTETYDGGHLTVKSVCTLWHIPTGQRMGSGEGSCSTKETKYAYRQGKRACPKCGAEAINKSKYPPRGRPQEAPGWYCYAKVGGCGAEFSADDPAIIGQETGRIANEDLADQYNTVLKMANKRALVAVVLNVTAASDIFTQDLEDLPEPTTTTERPRTGEVIEAKAEVVTAPNGDTPSYEPFGAITMVTKLHGGAFKPDVLEQYFPGCRNKSALEEVKAKDPENYRKAYDRLRAQYTTWKAEQPTAAA